MHRYSAPVTGCHALAAQAHSALLCSQTPAQCRTVVVHWWAGCFEGTFTFTCSCTSCSGKTKHVHACAMIRALRLRRSVRCPLRLRSLEVVRYFQTFLRSVHTSDPGPLLAHFGSRRPPPRRRRARTGPEVCRTGTTSAPQQGSRASDRGAAALAASASQA